MIEIVLAQSCLLTFPELAHIFTEPNMNLTPSQTHKFHQYLAIQGLAQWKHYTHWAIRLQDQTPLFASMTHLDRPTVCLILREIHEYLLESFTAWKLESLIYPLLKMKEPLLGEVMGIEGWCSKYFTETLL